MGGSYIAAANIELAGLEVSLVNCMNREKMLKQVLEGAKYDYDFILLDCTNLSNIGAENSDTRIKLERDSLGRVVKELSLIHI